ncbi:MAG: S9 family peptidase, partial [Candidatus Marinimicrobia bacterium]|nr:S9 family peptidase [Candidatus Neomarinimicrobiota bacterium]
MSKTFVFFGLFLVLLFFMLGCTQEVKQAEVPLIPMENFFKNPQKIAFQLSPNGEYLAFLQPWENRLNVHVQKIGEDEAVRVTDATERDIAGYFWANNNRLAFVKDKGGDENYKLYAVDVDASNLK